MAQENGNSGAKWLVPALGVLSVMLSIMFAIVQPIAQRVDSLESELHAVRDIVQQDRAQVAKVAERNQSKEAKRLICLTTNKAKTIELSKRVNDLESWRQWFNREVLTSISKLEEKVKNLERAEAGGASAQISGE